MPLYGQDSFQDENTDSELIGPFDETDDEVVWLCFDRQWKQARHGRWNPAG